MFSYFDSILFGTDTKQWRRPYTDNTHQRFAFSALDILVGRGNLRDLGWDRIELKYCPWEYSTCVKIRAASEFSKHNTLRERWCPYGCDHKYYSLLDVTSCCTSGTCRSFGKILLLPPATIKLKQQIHPNICKFVPDCSALYFRRYKSQPFRTLDFRRRSDQISVHGCALCDVRRTTHTHSQAHSEQYTTDTVSKTCCHSTNSS